MQNISELTARLSVVGTEKDVASETVDKLQKEVRGHNFAAPIACALSSFFFPYGFFSSRILRASSNESVQCLQTIPATSAKISPPPTRNCENFESEPCNWRK